MAEHPRETLSALQEWLGRTLNPSRIPSPAASGSASAGSAGVA
jgi:hypothetical protein